jgi:hypothetical protein
MGLEERFLGQLLGAAPTSGQPVRQGDDGPVLAAVEGIEVARHL